MTILHPRAKEVIAFSKDISRLAAAKSGAALAAYVKHRMPSDEGLRKLAETWVREDIVEGYLNSPDQPKMTDRASLVLAALGDKCGVLGQVRLYLHNMGEDQKNRDALLLNAIFLARDAARFLSPAATIEIAEEFMSRGHPFVAALLIGNLAKRAGDAERGRLMSIYGFALEKTKGNGMPEGLTRMQLGSRPVSDLLDVVTLRHEANAAYESAIFNGALDPMLRLHDAANWLLFNQDYHGASDAMWRLLRVVDKRRQHNPHELHDVAVLGRIECALLLGKIDAVPWLLDKLLEPNFGNMAAAVERTPRTDGAAAEAWVARIGSEIGGTTAEWRARLDARNAIARSG